MKKTIIASVTAGLIVWLITNRLRPNQRPEQRSYWV